MYVYAYIYVLYVYIFFFWLAMGEKICTKQLIHGAWYKKRRMANPEQSVSTNRGPILFTQFDVWRMSSATSHRSPLAKYGHAPHKLLASHRCILRWDGVRHCRYPALSAKLIGTVGRNTCWRSLPRTARGPSCRFQALGLIQPACPGLFGLPRGK